MKTVSEESASAAELETPHSMDEAMETGFLPDDEHYRLTGEFKSEKTDASAAATKKENPSEKPGASAASTEEKDESEIDDASAASSSKAAASETAKSQNEGRKENRWQKRERELKELREENARLKSQSSQPQQRSEPQQPSQAATETKAKAAPKPKIDDVDAKTGKPLYKNFAEYEDAKDAWLKTETLREWQETQAKTQQLTEQQQREREIGQSLTKKFEPVRAKYADFDKVALNENLTIPKGSVTELFLLDSDHAGEVLYHLGQHPEILGSFYANHDPKTGKFTSLITPQRQFRKLMEIEASLTGSLGSGTGANGDDKSSSSSAKPVTQASRPPHQVSGKGTVSKDAVEQALDDGDFETYQRAQNAKELARLKKK
jgi:hypothetical protein